MSNRKVPVNPVNIENVNYSILVIRGKRVMLNHDLAKLYGVTTRRLNEQVRRNPDRFPEDFMFQLTQEEKKEVVANCDHLSNLKHSQSTPFAFTEHGVIMLANVLNSPSAVNASIEVARAFVRLRGIMASYEELANKLETLEKKYDSRFKVVFDAIRQLMAPPAPKRRQVGFHWENDM